MSAPELSAPTTARWVEAARGGDRAAFGRLYDLYGRMVHGVLLARVPRDEVEDLVQEVFLKALRQLGGLREPRAFGGWLATIARNSAQDLIRRKVEARALDDQIAAPDSHADEAHAVLRLLRELPEAYRETLTLRLVEGMTGPEIAEQTGLTTGSVRVNLHRGMAMLRERMGVVGVRTGRR